MVNPFRSSVAALLLNLCLLCALVPSGFAAAETGSTAHTATRTATSTAQQQVSDEDIEECINDLTIAHAAATAASIVPIPGFSDAADAAAFVLNLALKECAPILTPSADRAFDPAADTDADPCTVTVRLPLTREALDQLVLDRQLLQESLNNSDLNLPPAFRAHLDELLQSEYGRFEQQTYGSYSNVFGILLSSATYGADWGEVGTPTVRHYNSDVQIILTHPGERVDANHVRFGPGTHTLRWTADTLISNEDFIYIPDPSSLGPIVERSAKEGVITALKKTIKEAIAEARKKGMSKFAREMAQEAGKNIAKLAYSELKDVSREQAMALALNTYYVDGDTHNVRNSQPQLLYVIDSRAPEISGVQDITVEALEPGGVTAGRHMVDLTAALTVTDDCDPQPSLTSNTPRFWPLSLQEDGSSIPSEITWTARDKGAAREPLGARNETQVVQRVSVVDTMPPILVAPPPVIREASGPITVSLGMAQVFDVADLRPTIGNDAPAQFAPGVHRIQWTATDFSGNVSAATDDTEQIVNIKPPGTNQLPTAFEQTGGDAIDAVADEPVRITVRGQDGDTPPDPLWFSIVEPPEHGFFIAPLYPYFIDDYRITARYSPQIAAAEGEDFAWALAADPSAMRDYMIALCEEEFSRQDLPRDFVSWNGGSEKYMAVDDDGYTYIYDSRYDKCSPGGSTIAPTTVRRISLWTPDGTYAGEVLTSSGHTPVTDIKFDLSRGHIFVVTNNSASNFSHITLYSIDRDNPDAPFEQVRSYNMMNGINSPGQRLQFYDANSAMIDTNGVLYALSRAPEQGLGVFYPDPTDPDSLNYVTHLVENSFNTVDDSGLDIRYLSNLALDSQNNLYVSAIVSRDVDGRAIDAPRIYKFSAATVDGGGHVEAGELIGWLGQCDRGPNCDYLSGRSIGYSCTDDTCLLDKGSDGSGEQPGQFDFDTNTGAIAIDPNDVLYIADSGNARVQRFNSEGLFAGEARSTGDGGGFVLGDFGAPDNIAVNSSSFYVIDRNEEIVHIFDAAVIHGIDDTSAWVEYQSDANYRGPDRFTFAATDGFQTAEGDLLQSAPATVAINVARNFRPPQATAGITISTTEETPVALTLSGYDLDDDGLTFQVTEPPNDGTLSGTPPTLTYTPRTDFAGTDSLAFVAVDDSGHADNRSQPEEVHIVVTPVNDAPTIHNDGTPDSAGVGFPLTLRALIVDAEADDRHTVRIDWGDGTVETDMEIDASGEMNGPALSANGTVTSTLVAYHVYNSPGTYALQAVATDAAGAQAQLDLAIRVEPMADLALERHGTNVVSSNRSEMSYRLTVQNRQPESGGGITANSVEVSETLGQGLSYVRASMDGGDCTVQERELRCTVASLPPGSTATIDVEAAAQSGLSVGTAIDNRAEAHAAEADPIPDNNVLDYPVTVLHNADFLVDSYREGGDAAPGDGACAAPDGTCTLRAAVQEANALPGKQSIALSRAVYMLNVYDPDEPAPAVEPAPEDGSATGDLDITDDVELLGLNANDTVLHANGADRVLEVHGATVTLRNLLLTGGLPLFNGDGGGLRNNGGTITLDRVAVIGNSAVGGGGISNVHGTLRVVDSSITGNGGGTGHGGGLSNNDVLVLENVTISGNSAASGGGLGAVDGSATLQNVTISDNTATSVGGGISGDGDAVQLANTILAGNRAPSGPNCGHSVRSNGHNLIGALSDCTILGETGSNVIDGGGNVDADVHVAELVRNGRGTYSQTPVRNGRAIDAGHCALSTDQRGVSRPQGDGCDIGAVEFTADDEEQVTSDGGIIYLPVTMR